ncbi:MAG TPA: hypothetical protein VHD33_06620 [Legionellaceae bacterium]|nr:hypothetical protein [Legionellaceae bacterium]HWC57899.1 hypothetical protein [Candidatus Paceibacterota bacterium]
MDQELGERLQAIEKKVDDTNSVVRKLYRSNRRATAVKALYWIILIVLGVISISLIKPYIGELKDAYGLGGDTPSSSSPSSYTDLLNSIK